MSRRNRALFLALNAVCLMSGGCATKKYLREAIAPVQNQLGQTQNQVTGLQKQSDANRDATREAIGDLDRTVATTSEKATEADKKASEAAEAAARANAAAAEAARLAEEANSAASRLDADLYRSLQNLNDYRQVAIEQIFFGINRTVLNKAESEKLNGLVEKINALKGYIVEVEGFADSTGNAAHNLELSQQRADAVVHFLTVEHDIPLLAIRELGVGSDFPGADNKTSEARKTNRRVDVKVYRRNLGNEAGAGVRSAP